MDQCGVTSYNQVLLDMETFQLTGLEFKRVADWPFNNVLTQSPGFLNVVIDATLAGFRGHLNGGGE